MGYERKVSKFEMIQFITGWHGNEYGTPSKLQRMKWAELWAICDKINHEDDNNFSEQTMLDPSICPYCGSENTSYISGSVDERRMCNECLRYYYVEYDPDSLSHEDYEDEGVYTKVLGVTNRCNASLLI